MSSDNVRRKTTRHLNEQVDRVETPSKKGCNRPSFLRLDSSGEDCVTSSPQPHINTTMCKACEARRMDKHRVVGSGLNMNCFLDTATSYVNTASAYIGGFCQQYTSANSLSGKVAGTSVFDYLNRLGSGRGTCNNIYSSQTHKDINTMPEHTKAPVVTPTWSGSLFGALKCRLRSAKHSEASIQKPEPYKPPHVRFMKDSVAVDPNLTPYNAKLLLKSKRCNQTKPESHDTQKRKLFDNTCREKHPSAPCSNSTVKPAVVAKNDTKQKKVAEQMTPLPADNSVIDDERATPSDIPSHAPACDTDSGDHSDEQKSTKDWFEHVNSDEKCIPISIKLESSCDSNEEPSSPVLFSWSSIEKDPNVQKEEFVEASSHCDNVNKLVDKNLSPKTSLTDDVHDENEQLQGKDVQTADVSETNPCNARLSQGDISVLYIRNMSKKRRPSSKKRRRQKKKQTEEQGDSESSNEKKCSMKKLNVSIATSSPSASSVSNSSISFILGFEPSHDPCDSFDFNSGSDWSDSSDLECDGDEDVEEFGNPQDWLADVLSPLNFHITCAVVNPTEPSISGSSTLDDINLSWKVNMAMSQKETKKTQSNKKVHFASDNELATVHPMITWSHAYQTARKGPWEEYARDRGRFQRRIHDSLKLLEPVLASSHRDAVFHQRFNCVDL